MKVTFLGTGTSLGIPVIACDCAVCSSDDPRNNRLRSSIYLEVDGTYILVDTTPDFRTQALTHKVRRVDHLLMSHTHADHIFGFDDIRRFNTIQKSAIPVHGGPATLTRLQEIYDYVSPAEARPGFFVPQVAFTIFEGPFQAGPVKVTPIEVFHGRLETYGFLFEHDKLRFGYFPDCKSMSDDAVNMLKGVDVMVLDALRDREHPTHLSVNESLSYLERIDARQSYLIHMCHDLEHTALAERVPDRVHVAYDGLTLDLKTC